MPELSIRRRVKATLVLPILFVSWEENWLLSWFFDRTAGFWQSLIFFERSQCMQRRRANHFFRRFSIFLFLAGPSGTVNFVSPRPQCSPRLRLGEHWGSRGIKTHCFPCGFTTGVCKKHALCPLKGQMAHKRRLSSCFKSVGTKHSNNYLKCDAVSQTAFYNSNRGRVRIIIIT